MSEPQTAWRHSRLATEAARVPRSCPLGGDLIRPAGQWCIVWRPHCDRLMTAPPHPNNCGTSLIITTADVLVTQRSCTHTHTHHETAWHMKSIHKQNNPPCCNTKPIYMSRGNISMCPDWDTVSSLRLSEKAHVWRSGVHPASAPSCHHSIGTHPSSEERGEATADRLQAARRANLRARSRRAKKKRTDIWKQWELCRMHRAHPLPRAGVLFTRLFIWTNAYLEKKGWIVAADKCMARGRGLGGSIMEVKLKQTPKCVHKWRKGGWQCNLQYTTLL